MTSLVQNELWFIAIYLFNILLFLLFYDLKVDLLACIFLWQKLESWLTLLIGSMSCTQYYGDVIMDAIASQITSLTIVYSIVYSDTDQRKHQSSASLAFVQGIHWGPVNSPHKWPVMRKMFPLDDVIMSLTQWWLSTWQTVIALYFFTKKKNNCVLNEGPLSTPSWQIFNNQINSVELLSLSMHFQFVKCCWNVLSVHDTHCCRVWAKTTQTFWLQNLSIVVYKIVAVIKNK